MTEEIILTLTQHQALIIKTLIKWDHYWKSYSWLSDETGIPEESLKADMKVMAKFGWVEYIKGLMNDDGETGGSGWFVVYPFERQLEAALAQYEVTAPDSWREVNAWNVIKNNTLGGDNHLVTGSVNLLIEIAVKRAKKSSIV